MEKLVQWSFIKYSYAEHITDNVTGKVRIGYGRGEKFIPYFSPKFWWEKTTSDTDIQEGTQHQDEAWRNIMGANWIQLLQDRDQLQDLVKTVAQIRGI
jgi:hypothetical protein